MGGTSIWHWIVVGLIVVLLFGRGKISDMMGDVAKGIKAFKKGMSEDETPAKPVPPSEPVRTIDHQNGTTTTTVTTDHKVG
jgi:sec-independent protein translocase protein TatA